VSRSPAANERHAGTADEQPSIRRYPLPRSSFLRGVQRPVSDRVSIRARLATLSATPASKVNSPGASTRIASAGVDPAGAADRGGTGKPDADAEARLPTLLLPSGTLRTAAGAPPLVESPLWHAIAGTTHRHAKIPAAPQLLRPISRESRPPFRGRQPGIG